jgi:hypothetical protein
MREGNVSGTGKPQAKQQGGFTVGGYGSGDKVRH